MTTKTEIDVQAMSDSDLERIAVLAQAEIEARAKRRKDETIAKIRALAGDHGIVVSIGGTRGKSARGKPKKTRERVA